MFKNLILMRIAKGWQPGVGDIEAALEKARFQPCQPTQQKSVGFIAPRGNEHDALVESIGGHLILRLMVEVKSVPGDVLNRKVKEKAARIEQETGRKPGKKESKELKEESLIDLLPMAFPKQSSTWVWIDREARVLAIDSSSHARADDIVSLLVEALSGLSVSYINTITSPQAAMANWLSTQEPPAGFSIDRECELKSCDESKAVVRYGRHPLDIAEVQGHIAQGKLPTKLAMTWDDRVSFLMTEGMVLKKISFLDTVFEGAKSDDSGFDADVAIATGELVRLIPDLVDALGGESESGIAGAAAAGSESSAS